MKKSFLLLLLAAIATTCFSFSLPQKTGFEKQESLKKSRKYFAGTTTLPAGNGCTWYIEMTGYADFSNTTGLLESVTFTYFTAKKVCNSGGGWLYAKDVDATATTSGSLIDDVLLTKYNDPEIVLLFNDNLSKNNIIDDLNDLIK